MNIEQVFEVVREELNEIYEEYEFNKSLINKIESAIKEELKFRIIEPAQLISIITGVAYGAQKTAKDGRIVSERIDTIKKTAEHMVKIYIDGDEEELVEDYSHNI